LIEHALDGRRPEVHAQWDRRPPLGVVMAAENYPGTPRLGDPVSEWDVPAIEDTKVFHAGTRLEHGQIVTSGGRVLCVCALGDTVADAQARAYAEVAGISWHGEFHRHDIGGGALARGRARCTPPPPRPCSSCRTSCSRPLPDRSPRSWRNHG